MTGWFFCHKDGVLDGWMIERLDDWMVFLSYGWSIGWLDDDRMVG